MNIISNENGFFFCDLNSLIRPRCRLGSQGSGLSSRWSRCPRQESHRGDISGGPADGVRY